MFSLFSGLRLLYLLLSLQYFRKQMILINYVRLIIDFKFGKAFFIQRKKHHFDTIVKATIIFKIFWDFLMLYQIILLPQVKRCAIITYKHDIYELPHELLNDLKLRILGNQKISGKRLNFIEWYPSAQSSCQIKILSILAKNSWKIEIRLFP